MTEELFLTSSVQAVASQKTDGTTIVSFPLALWDDWGKVDYLHCG